MNVPQGFLSDFTHVKFREKTYENYDRGSIHQTIIKSSLGLKISFTTDLYGVSIVSFLDRDEKVNEYC